MFVDDTKIDTKFNEATFWHINEKSLIYFEVTANSKHYRRSPFTNIFFFMYQYAKFHMLCFYYEFLYHFLKENYFQLAQMDTDSQYFGIGVEQLDDCVKDTE